MSFDSLVVGLLGMVGFRRLIVLLCWYSTPGNQFCGLRGFVICSAVLGLVVAWCIALGLLRVLY